MQPEPRFHGHSIRTKNPMSPASSASSTEKKTTVSLEEFKEWLTLFVNSKKHAEEGYNISPVCMDFEKTTGKILDEKLLGFLKIINLVEYCKDVVVIREVKRGCHLAFPVKPNERENRMPLLPLPGGRNSYPNKNCQSKDKTRSESKPKPKRKASAEDFRKCIYHMRQAGEFSQGFLMARLPQRFEQRTRKFRDVEHLRYKRMSELVASCSDPVTMKWDIFKISASVRLGTVILVAMERMTGGRYSVVEKLGSGSFGEVYKGIDVETEENAAIKMERKDAKHPQLFHDSKIYEHIPEGMGIPNIRWRGTKIDHSILVLDLLGPSLGNIFGYRQCKFNLKMVLMLADQLIERIEYIYRRSVLHRDLKLDDLLMGISLTSKLVHLNDFGLSKLFQNSNSMRHIPLTTHKGLTRTVHYASINNHRGIEQSRRDDIESIGYALLYFLRGNLPWQDVMDSNKKRKFENICEMKMATPIEYLCYEDDNVFEWTPMLKRHRLQNSRAGVPGPLPPVESESSSPSVTPPPLPLEAFPLLKDINFPMTNDFKRYNDQFMMFRGRNILKSEAM